MPTQTKTSPTDHINEASERLVIFNEKAVANSKQAQSAFLDSYEKAVLKIADTYETAAGATNVEWLGDIARTQAGLTRDLTKTYVSAARDLVS
jgi:hypothetical protein